MRTTTLTFWRKEFKKNFWKAGCCISWLVFNHWNKWWR